MGCSQSVHEQKTMSCGNMGGMHHLGGWNMGNLWCESSHRYYVLHILINIQSHFQGY